jgi:pyruvate/2-oxoglutarate dehydrogenase complex dihydrolipoamide dehydrogenase (E3) component
MMCGTGRAPDDELVTEQYDVIIVGSGAGGGTLAHTLAPTSALTAMANAIRVGEHLLSRMS